MKSNEKIYSTSYYSDLDNLSSWINERSSLIYYKLFSGMLEVEVGWLLVDGNGANELILNSVFYLRVDFLANGNIVSSSLTFGKNLLARILITLLELFNLTVSNG